jgi:hypothetical protein
MQTPSTVSATTLEWWRQLGPWRDYDDESGTYDLLTFIDAIGSLYDVTEEYIRDYAPVVWDNVLTYHGVPDHIGWGALLDVSVCPAQALDWLAQFAGAIVRDDMTDDQKRIVIQSLAGFARGTPATMIAAAKLLLTGTQWVRIIERSPDAYSLVVETLAAQTPDPVAVLAVLIAAKPAGLILSYIVEEGATWADVVGTWGAQTLTWAAFSNVTVI